MSYKYILFPGRHHVLTTFQIDYLREAIGTGLEDIDDILVDADGAQVVFVVTSADHGNTRRNPFPGHRREAMIEGLSLETLTYLINDVPLNTRFAEYMLHAIEAENGPIFTPENTVLACSTPSVIAQFQSLGFRILPVELKKDGDFQAQRPWDLIEKIIADELLTEETEKLIHPASVHVLKKYNLFERLVELHADPLLSDEGEVTATRDYKTYAAAFDASAARKWETIKPWVQPGRIVDLGCGVGSLLEEIATDPNFGESDLYGIEAARPLYEECLHRQHQGVFKNPNTFFYHRNFTRKNIFPAHSVNTIITAALCHEIFSYLGEDTLQKSIEMFKEQLAPGGTWVNLDVCGPEQGERIVWLEVFSEPPRANWQPLELAKINNPKQALEELNVIENFLQFAHDWNRVHPLQPANFEVLQGKNQIFIETNLNFVMEWLLKKDYVDSWLSEVKESFCFWDYRDWQESLENNNFTVAAASHAFTNLWLVEHSFEPVAVLHPPGEPGTALSWPCTHLLTVAI